MNRLISTVRSTASRGATTALLLLPPWALVRLVGWPLPRKAPDLDSMRQAFEVGIPDDVLVSTLAVLAWLLWAQVAIALLAEIVALIRRRPTARLPLLPGLQALAARLVSGSLIVASSFGTPALAFAGVAPAPTPAVLAFDPLTLVEQPPPPSPRTTSAPAPAATFETVTVQSHDSYWAIAERHLGDGRRWREVREANVGRQMSDGHIVSASDELLRPGWMLQIPSEGQPANVGSSSSDGTVVQAQRGDSLWSIAAVAVEDHLGRPPTDAEVRPYWQATVQTNAPALWSGPDIIHAGQPITLPPPVVETPGPPPPPGEPQPAPTPSPPDPAPPPVSAPPVPPARDGATDPPPPATAHDSSSDGDRASTSDEGVATFVLGGLASAGIAVGAVAAIRRRRRRFSHQDPTLPAPATPEDDRQLHRALLLHADDSPVSRLRTAMAGLAAAFAAEGRPQRPRIVQASANHVDVLLDDDGGNPPDGWELAADGVWANTSPLEPSEGADGEVAPLLVTIGAPDDDGQMYLDLEAERVVSLTGDGDVAAQVARSMAVELALRAPSEAVEIVLVGDIVDRSLDGLGHTTFVERWADAADDVCERAEQTSRSVSASGWPSPFAGRSVDPTHDALAPLVVIAAEPPPDHVIQALDRNPHGTVAVVAIGADEAPGTIVRCAPDELLLPAIGLRCRPQQVDDDLIEPLVHLITGPEEDQPADAEAPHDEADSDATEPEPPDPTPPPPAEATPEYDVLVRLLGDITVEGSRRRLSPKPTAIVAYVALHRDVPTEQLEEACWSEPGLADHRRRLRDLVSQCRAAIGAANLPTADDGRYRAGPRLLTDTDLFSWHVERAARLAPADAAAAYRMALDLVTGRIFTYPSKASTSYTWIDVENLVNQWEVRIAGVAQQCAATYLDLGNPGAAIEVLNHVAAALPLHSGLIEMLMRAHARMGDQRAVRTAYASYVAALDDLDLDVEPSVQDVFLEFGGGRCGA